ncbi:MAG: hypothetical protein QG629_566 [Patescibacteria group bacterium]|nr:hypothetical protein [Patescibacteria group bacterium]
MALGNETKPTVYSHRVERKTRISLGLLFFPEEQTGILKERITAGIVTDYLCLCKTRVSNG